MNDLLNKVAQQYESSTSTDSADVLVNEFLDGLERGEIRAASKVNNIWTVDARVKAGILLAFRVGVKEKVTVGPSTFIDKHNLWPRKFELDDDVRIVPSSSTIRRGAYLGGNVVVMPPSYVNIGAFVDEGSLIDSHALVGSCAQVGKRVHLSAAAQLGGVIEPIGALPVIVEDDVLIGGNCGIYEGTEIGARAVIGAGVILTKSSKVFDLVNECVISANGDENLKIPSRAVVVQGARAIASEYGKAMGLSVSAPLIIKYRDEKTDEKVKLEELLR